MPPALMDPQDHLPSFFVDVDNPLLPSRPSGSPASSPGLSSRRSLPPQSTAALATSSASRRPLPRIERERSRIRRSINDSRRSASSGHSPQSRSPSSSTYDSDDSLFSSFVTPPRQQHEHSSQSTPQDHSSATSTSVVDLTHTSPPVMAPRTRQKRSPNQCRASSDPRSPKRRKGLATSPRKRLKVDPDEGVEEVDLLEVDDDTELSALLRKQREEQVKGQQTDDSGPPSFSALTCIICLDTPTALTVTACGHYFCHQCLMEALIAGETDNRSRCPVCREKVQRTKRSKANYHDFEVLELKLSKRKRKGKGPAVA